ncbi:HAAS signaling domain-containing protein [Gluconobacter sp.]|uniref:HAAS signaling domain-containing protein n=1 Tax=Gluconobacter sp. TaxID=1876758 RepID=UPI0039EBC1DB
MMPASSSLDGWKDSDLLSLPVERYLHEFRGGLLSLPESERDMIVAEVRAQVAAQARLGEGAALALLEKLGKPDRLAARFTIRHELSVGVQQSNPFGLFWVLLRLAAGSLLAFVGGLVVIVLGLMGLLLTVMPVLRLFVPQDLFMVDDSLFSLTVTTDGAPKNAIPLSWTAAIIACGIGVVFILLAMVLLRGLGQVLLRDMRRKTQALD